MELTHKENLLIKSFSNLTHELCIDSHKYCKEAATLHGKGLIRCNYLYDSNDKWITFNLTEEGKALYDGRRAYEVEIPDRHKIRMDYLDTCKASCLLTELRETVNELILRENMRNDHE